jgi:hypothetical protein
MAYVPTRHAQKRMQQRAIRPQDVEHAARFGQVLYAAGAQFIFVGQRDIPRPLRRELDYLEGLTLVVAPETGRLLTSYRNRDGLRDIKRKLKRSSRHVQACA